MKRCLLAMILVLLLFPIIMQVNCYAEDSDVFLSTSDSHSSLNDPYVLTADSDFGKLLQFNTDDPKNRIGMWPIFFSTTVPEEGTLYLTITFDKLNGLGRHRVRVYDRLGNIIEGEEKFTPGIPYRFEYKLNANESISFEFGTVGAGRASGTFSICFNDKHKIGAFSEVTKQATCLEAGVLSWPCELCNQIAQSQETQATGHQPSEEHVLSEPTCLSAGLKGITCDVCGEILSSEKLPKVDHTPGKFVEIKKATCTEPGINEQHCTVCNATLATENTDPLGHTLGKWVITKEATCLEEGRKEQRCEVCDEVINTESIEKSTHSLDKWETAKEATCLEEGLRVQRCSICGEVINSQTLEMIGHSFGKWEVTSEPTEDTSGIQKRECYVCAYTEFVTIEKLSQEHRSLFGCSFNK